MQFFPFIFGFIIIALGIVLTVLGARQKKKKTLKAFLLLAGISALSWLPLVVLHNMFYAFAIVLMPFSGFLSTMMEEFEVIFFLMATPVCPLAFIVGVIGAIITAIKK